MAYLRGSTYIWSDGERVHLWSQDGLDHWRDTEFGRHPEASGVALRQETLDHFVCMRLAELVAAGKLEATVRSALAEAAGNFGCSALSELGPTIVERLQGLPAR
jgi:hypothetical protein